MFYCKSRTAHALSLREHGAMLGAWLIPLFLGVLTLVALFAAYWQWQRQAHHLDLAAQAQASLASAPIFINAQALAAAGRPVTVTGQWLAGSTVRIAPRLDAGRMGEWVVSVLQYRAADGSLRHIAVHRGWRLVNMTKDMNKDMTKNMSKNVAEDMTQGEISLTGQMASALGRSFELATPPAPSALGVWQNHDLAQHGKILNISLDLQILVQYTSTPAIPGWVRLDPKAAPAQWQDKADKNLGYRVQWLGLAAVGLAGLAWMGWTGWRGRNRVSAVAKLGD